MELNPEIISEIAGARDADEKTKAFLKWLVEFEKEHIDRDRPAFKQEIIIKIDEFLRNS